MHGRLQHMRLIEIPDTRNTGEQGAEEGKLLSDLGIGAALVEGFSIGDQAAGFLALFSASPVPAWNVELYLLMKLIGSSLASGMGRLREGLMLAEVREREDLYSHAANDGMWDFDVDANTLTFSPRWKEMLGYGPDELTESSPDWHHLVHPDDMARVQAPMREHLDGKTALFESVHRMRHRNGEWRWVIEPRQGAHRRGGPPAPPGRRRTRHHRAQALRGSAVPREGERTDHAAVDRRRRRSPPMPTCRVEYLNPVAEELTGWKLEDASGRPIDEIFRGFHEETCEPLENPLAVAIRRNRSIKSVRPTLLIRRDGNELYIESTAAPIRDDVGHDLRRRAGVPRRQRIARAEPPSQLPRQPRHADRAGQPP